MPTTDHRTAGDLCTRDVVTVLRSTPVNEAARLLRERHVGCVVVVDPTPEGPLVAGLLTDRDIVTAVVAKDVNPLLLRVGEVMSDEVTTIGESASAYSAIALIRHRRVRRMPVVAPGGQLVGLLSADDVIRLLAGELQALSDAVAEQRQVEQLTRP